MTPSCEQDPCPENILICAVYDNISKGEKLNYFWWSASLEVNLALKTATSSTHMLGTSRAVCSLCIAVFRNGL